ncbi:TPA_asm: hypothetical protein G1H58_07155 [Salmonella enterica subsp. enterica]|uniref:Uncharacterized protein n=1 Tax=Salmonella enterica I TaxID=59201 RepID=A0A711TSJ9_SALET|nr:hypothetical protein [Salmonella enterica subsp. enterica]HAD2872582.1 hypothetical protein [Salmonella enterica subsp. enterica]
MKLPAAACSILALVSKRSLTLSLSIRIISTSGRAFCLIWPALRVSPHNKCHAAFSFDTSKLTIACFSSGF